MNIASTPCSKKVTLVHPELPCDFYIETGDGQAGLCTCASNFRCAEAMKEFGMKLSYSHVADYLRCKRLYWYKHVMGLEPYDQALSPSLKMGKLWDLAQNRIYNVVSDSSEIDNYILSASMADYQVANVRACYRAYQQFVTPDMDKLVGLQNEFQFHNYDVDNGDLFVHGFYDRLYTDHFVECKFSGRPEYYTGSPFSMISQVGTYFLADEKLEYCDMEVTRAPQLRQGAEESAEDFEERIFKDIWKRPSYYFIGYNRESKKFGKRYYRNEFDLGMLQRRYGIITREIKEMSERNSYYCNSATCQMYGGTCEFEGVCTNGGYVSESQYKMRDKEKLTRL